MTRRLPVYILADCSGSMLGNKMESVKAGIRELQNALLGDPAAVEAAYISIITFDSSARQLAPLTEIAQFQPPDLTASGTTAMGEALRILCERLDTKVARTRARLRVTGGRSYFSCRMVP